MTFECVHWHPYEKGTLQGFANIHVPKMGMTFFSLTLHEKGNQKWVGFPSKIYEKDGKTEYLPYYRFDNPEHKKMFMEKAMEAVKLYKQNNETTGENDDGLGSSMYPA